MDGSRQDEGVVWNLPKGSQLYRARVCDSTAKLKEFYADPFEKVGPPVPQHARAGRMNVEGVTMFYGARDIETCLAEMRPALGGDTAVIELQTTIALRVLDFTKLEESHGVGLSYFQPDFDAEVDRLAFLRRLHTLISRTGNARSRVGLLDYANHGRISRTCAPRTVRRYSIQIGSAGGRHQCCLVSRAQSQHDSWQ